MITISLSRDWSLRVLFTVKKNCIVTGHENIVELLIENGADVHAINGYDNTPLINAIHNSMTSHTNNTHFPQIKLFFPEFRERLHKSKKFHPFP